jgi:hypothetical protein
MAVSGTGGAVGHPRCIRPVPDPTTTSLPRQVARLRRRHSKRLLPVVAEDKLAHIDGERVRGWLAEMVELVRAGELAPKTVDNARTYLSVACNVAAHRGLMPRNRATPSRPSQYGVAPSFARDPTLRGCRRVPG